MELVYIWTKAFRDLFYDCGFNLSSEFLIQYNLNQLEIRKNNNHLDNFFCNPEETVRISNVTAIIGENGVGKTSILEFIRDNLVYGETLKGIQNKAIIVLQDVASKKLVIYYHSEISLEIKNFSDALCAEPIAFDRESDHVEVSVKNARWLKNLEETTFIYFSNIFDNKPTNIRDGNYLDISTNHLLQTENRGHILLRPVETHRVADTVRQVRFLQDFNIDEKSFNVFPRMLEFSLLELEVDFYDRFEKIDDLRNGSSYDWNDQVTALTSDVFESIEFKNPRYGKFLNNLFQTITYYFFLAIYEFDFDFEDPKLLFKEDMDPTDKVHYFFDECLRKYDDYLKDSLEDLFDALQKHIEQNPDCVINERSLLLPIEKGGFLNELLELYQEVSSSSFGDFAVFDWFGISTGQKAFLNICSRLYYTRTSSLNNRLKKNLIILMDEAELSLHPQWQKDLIRYLLKQLPVIYRGSQIQNIQLILTSNSPFIISDLPSSNVIFIQKDQNRARIIDGLDDKKQTFASNIHSLLAHSFFMQDGLIGTFAQEKINQLIQLFVNNEGSELIRKNKERIEKTINIIGEPLIKNKLLSMLRERLTMNFITVEERIQELEEVILRLKQQNKGDGE